MKAYNRKSDARRAAVRELAKAESMSTAEVKAAEGTLFTIEAHPELDGKFYWRRVQKADVVVEMPSNEALFEPKSEPAPDFADVVAKVEDEPVAEQPTPEETAVENADAEAADNMTADGVLHKSVITNPCQFVWDMAEQMKGSRRCDVVNACTAAGVATHTARTQYQRWYSANKADEQRLAAQAVETKTDAA